MIKRLETLGANEWKRTAQPDDPNKYFIVSAGCHANEPKDWVKSRIAPEYLKRLPRREVRDGQSFIIIEGNRPWKIKTDTTDWGPEDKVEPPEGDSTRIHGRKVQGISGFFNQQNAGKRNICLDLRAQGAVELVKALVAVADIVLENYRPGVMTRH